MIDKTFLLAGKALFTVSNPKGEFFTFRVEKPKRDFRGEFFASVLDKGDFRYMGMVSEKLTFRTTAGSKFIPEEPAPRVLAFALKLVSGALDPATLPPGYTLEPGRHGAVAAATDLATSLMKVTGSVAATVTDDGPITVTVGGTEPSGPRLVPVPCQNTLSPLVAMARALEGK